MRAFARRSPGWAVVVVVIALVAGFAGTSSGSGASKAAASKFGVGLKLGKTIGEAPVDPATKGPYLVWNKATCSYQKSPVQPTRYRALLRKIVGPFKIAFLAAEEAEPFSVANTKDIELQARRAGFQLDFYNMHYPSQTDPLADAKAAVLKHDQGAISAQEIPTLNPAFDKILQTQGCVPTVQLYLLHSNVPSMGANWGSVGRIDGTWLAQYGKQHSIKPATTAFVECTNPDVGESVNVMFDTAPAALKAGSFVIPKGNLFKLVCREGTPGASESAVTDWFTAHPNFDHVMFNCIDDETMHEIANAIRKTGNTAKAITIANGADSLGQAQIRNGQEMATVAFFPEKYGQWDIPLMEDILAGNPVPSFMATSLTVITKGNIAKYYPH
jgi:ribose transport system substrate-binding protein